MSPKVSQEYMEARRDEIVDAALRCFSRLGLDRTTLRDISAESGLSLGTLYHHFPKKSDIIHALRQRSTEDEDAAYFETRPPPADRAYLQHAVEFLFSRPDLPESLNANRVAAMLWAHALLDEETLAGQVDSLSRGRAEMNRAVASMQEAGVINRSIDPDYVFLVIVGVLMGVQIQKNWEPEISAAKAGQVFQAILNGEFWAKETGADTTAPRRTAGSGRKGASRGKR